MTKSSRRLKRFRLTKSTVTKMLDCAAPQSFLFLSILNFVGLYFTLLLQHQRAGVCSFTTIITDVTNYAIGLGQGHASLYRLWLPSHALKVGMGAVNRLNDKFSVNALENE